MAAGPTILSFAYSQGDPPEADRVHDMRFLRNPHWQEGLRDGDGRDPEVAAYIAGDPAYAEALARIETDLLSHCGKAGPGLLVAFGCTGGRHRSVHVAEHIAKRLRAAGFSPTLVHRDLATPPSDDIGRSPGAGTSVFQGE
jgi:UPF0042 nucleotide-binding protein